MEIYDSDVMAQFYVVYDLDADIVIEGAIYANDVSGVYCLPIVDEFGRQVYQQGQLCTTVKKGNIAILPIKVSEKLKPTRRVFGYPGYKLTREKKPCR